MLPKEQLFVNQKISYMFKTAELNELFKEWENETEGYKDHFVRDGIINEESWKNATHKILYITKEPNNNKQEAGDYREWWKTDVKFGFGMRLAEWTHAINNISQPFDEIKNKSHKDILQQVALMNIKKTGGVGMSDGGVIRDECIKCKKHIVKQIDIIDPDIIILCLSWNHEINKMLFPDLEWNDSGWDIKVGRWKEEKKIIDFYHPSARNGLAASYSLLQNVMKYFEKKENVV
jgi:hypothetical protein